MLAALAELTAKHDDARCALLIGKGALGRGHPFDHYAFPTFGLPRYTAIGPDGRAGGGLFDRAPGERLQSEGRVERQRARPHAGDARSRPLRRQEIQRRLRPEAACCNDNVYNMQIGAAELGDDIAAYNGSYILAFAGYNAGRGRVKEWIERYGDPRDPKVDPIDWVERIPFSETRNYVQRIIENMQVYRARFGGGKRLLIEADLRRGAGTAN